MFSLRYLALAAIAAAGADAFVAPGALPMQRSRAVAQSGLGRVRCQEQEGSKVQNSNKPVATGGTDYSKVPKKEVRTTLDAALLFNPCVSVDGFCTVSKFHRFWLVA